MFMLTLNYETVRYDRYFCVLGVVKLCSCILSRVLLRILLINECKMVVLCDGVVVDGRFLLFSVWIDIEKEVQ